MTKWILGGIGLVAVGTGIYFGVKIARKGAERRRKEAEEAQTRAETLNKEVKLMTGEQLDQRVDELFARIFEDGKND